MMLQGNTFQFYCHQNQVKSIAYSIMNNVYFLSGVIIFIGYFCFENSLTVNKTLHVFNNNGINIL